MHLRPTVLRVIRLAVIDFQPSWPGVVNSFMAEDGEDLKTRLGVDFQIEFFKPDEFPLQDSERLANFDLVLADLEDRDLRFGSQVLACFESLKAANKVIFASEQLTSPHIMQLAAKTHTKKLLEKPALNKDFTNMFERLSRIHLANTMEA